MIHHSTKEQTRTFLGRTARVQQYHLNSSRMGPRVVVMQWQDGTGEVEVRAIRGDGRRQDFEQRGAVELVNPTADQLQAAVSEMSALL